MSDTRKRLEAVLDEIESIQQKISQLQQMVIAEMNNQAKHQSQTSADPEAPRSEQALQKQPIDNKSKYVFNESKTIYEVKPGSIVRYGTYPQTESGTDKTPIEWLVLEVQGNRALLLSRYGLDAHRFDASFECRGWANSEIRAWLNDSFLKHAFTSEEQLYIEVANTRTPGNRGYGGGPDSEDKLWLLSCEEASTYLTNSCARKCIPTVYAVKNGAYQYSGNDSSYMLNSTGCCWWWLRQPNNCGIDASSVSDSGSLHQDGVNLTSGSVRPALWLNLDSAVID